ncbi:hypothetical protein [Tumebacillus lipolyticus]|uniref:Uncharacterized protein n=1 Tax=Tumebacillus lipolyticus TaxID=1280370 RepID=A0ABW4ZSX4_9BACL
MPYQSKTNWQHEDVVTEQDLNRIEGGILEAQEMVDEHVSRTDNPHGVTPEQIEAETPAGAQARVDSHANRRDNPHGVTAGQIPIEDTAGHFATRDVEGALAEVFTHGVDGKAQITAAISAKGGAVPGSAPHSFAELAMGVGSIHVGDYSVGEKIEYKSLGLKNPPHYPIAGFGSERLAITACDSFGFVYVLVLGAKSIRKYDPVTWNYTLLQLPAPHTTKTIEVFQMYNDEIYAVFMDGSYRVAKLSLDGAGSWVSVSASPYYPSGFVVRESGVYLVDQSYIRKFNRLTGAEEWRRFASSYNLLNLAVDEGEMYFYIITTDGSNTVILSKMKLNGAGFASIWTGYPGGNYQIAALEDEYVYCGGKRYGSTSGTPLWSVSFGDGVTAAFALPDRSVIFGARSGGQIKKFSSDGSTIYDLVRPFDNVLSNPLNLSPKNFAVFEGSVYAQEEYYFIKICETLKITK